MTDRENRDAANTAAAFRRAAHLLTVFAEQRWDGEQINVMEGFGGIIRDMCHDLATTLAFRRDSSEIEFRRLTQALWNAVQAGAGLPRTQLFANTALDPKLVVLRHLFDTARRAARLESRSDREWGMTIGSLGQHTQNPIPSNDLHTLCDPSADSSTLWGLLPATGASVTSEIPELEVAWYRNRGAMQPATGLCCAEVQFAPCEVSDEPYASIEKAQEGLDNQFFRADLSTLLSLLLTQPHLLKRGELYMFSGVSRPHQGEDQYPMVMGGTRPHCWFGRPKIGELYASVRLIP